MAERENTVWGEIRVQLSDVQNFLLNGQYKEAVILDKEILTFLDPNKQNKEYTGSVLVGLLKP